MSASQDKFQQLLRELFQFDSADLDFGIYRIMNRKRAVIERFITEDLSKAISDELSQGAMADQGARSHELEEARNKIAAMGKDFGETPLDADGNLTPAWHDRPIGRQYLELMAGAAGARDHGAQEAAVYNHLYTFFSRY